jgi:hypothetical protein
MAEDTPILVFQNLVMVRKNLQIPLAMANA